MSAINPKSSISKLVEVDGTERENNVKLKMEMLKLVRERERLKKEVDLLEKTQSFTELEKFSLEEKLERSERRCEELDAEVKKLRRKKMESEKAAQLYKSRVDDLEPRLLKMEARFGKMLNANMPDFAENGEVKVNAEVAGGNGGIGIGFSKKGGRKSGYISKVAQAQCKGPFHDNEEKKPQVRGGRNLVSSGTEEDGENVKKKSKVDESKGRLQDIVDANPEVRGASYRMSLYCRCTLTTIDVIKQNLQKENLEIFEQSCFSNLFKMNEFKYQGELILQLMLHLDMSASKKERLIFKINNSNMEFGPSDFFRITGLRFGKLGAKVTATSSSIQKDVFQGSSTIPMKNIKKAFLSISSCHKGKGELTLKMALVYFLYGTVLAKHHYEKIDVQHLYLVEDLQNFNAFPWGRIAYDLLVSSIIKLRLRMDGSEVTHQVARFEIYGFCYALQAWAYEVMPCVATYCASRVNNFENITPWILHWSVKRVLRFDDLKEFFQLGDKAHLNNTMGKSKELSTDTNPHASTPLSRAKQKKRKLRCDSDQMPHAQPSSTATLPPSTNKATDDHAKIERSLRETETTALSEPAKDNHAQDSLWKTYNVLKVSEPEYKRTKEVYEKLLNRSKHLKLWIGYAKFEAFAMNDTLEDPDLPDKRKCLERARAVFERGLSYFRSCGPESNEKRAMLLEEWLDMESSFGEVGDVNLVQVKLPQKLKKRRMHVASDDDDGYEEYIEYQFLE